ARHAGLTGLRQIVAVEYEAGGGAMLEPAVSFADGEAEKPVPIVRRRSTERIDLDLTELPEIGGHAVEIRFEAPCHDEVVRYAAGFELDAFEIADVDGMIDELVVIRCRVAAVPLVVDGDALHRSRDTPVLAC